MDKVLINAATPNHLCFFCGGHQDISLLWIDGAEYKAAADHSCPLCRQLVGPTAAAIYEVTDKNPGCGNPQAQEGIWYTGRWTTINKSQLVQIYKPEVAARIAAAGAGILNVFNYRGHRLDTYAKGILQ